MTHRAIVAIHLSSSPIRSFIRGDGILFGISLLIRAFNARCAIIRSNGIGGAAVATGALPVPNQK
jgi:hypothetical protein